MDKGKYIRTNKVRKKQKESMKRFYANGGVHSFKGKHHTGTTKDIISKKNKGRKHTKKWKEENSKRLKGKTYEVLYGDRAELEKKKRSDAHKNKVFTIKHRENISKALKGKRLGIKRPEHSKAMSDSNHPNWQNGKSFEPYGLEFNKDLKEVIRNRDKRKCFICEKKELKEKLIVHHIDYNKKNNNPNNLISLCRSCHTKTNYDRNYWIKYFNEKLK